MKWKIESLRLFGALYRETSMLWDKSDCLLSVTRMILR